MLSTANIDSKLDKFDQLLAQRERSKNPVNDSTVHQTLSVIRKLNTARFSVYLAFSKAQKQLYAMKLFPYIGEASDPNYQNEARFAFVKHPNVINFIYCEKERTTIKHGQLGKVSYILMEYAPYGDFFNFITDHRKQIDDRLARTYFRQLIDGIEYLHKNGVAHLDLKPENLLIGYDFNLKIIDFDLSFMCGDAEVLSRGTKHYRAPELPKMLVQLPFAADIYSAGVILFILKSGGVYPYTEEDGPDGLDTSEFAELMFKGKEKFWKKHCELEKRASSFYDSSFKKLFSGMVKYKPSARLNLQEVKRSVWYNGPVYSYEELCEKMNDFLNR